MAVVLILSVTSLVESAQVVFINDALSPVRDRSKYRPAANLVPLHLIVLLFNYRNKKHRNPCKPLYMFVACGTTIVLSAESSRPDVRVTPVFSHTPWGST